MTDFKDIRAEGATYVMLELARRVNSPIDDNQNTIHTNRIGLYCESINISTSKTTMPFEVPFSGLISGESTTLVMDAGMARKQISLQGFITDQTIHKRSGSDTPKQAKLTSYEVAQLLHSYVDSSFLQEDQNPSKLIVLIPSRYDDEYDLRAGITDDTAHADLPLIPFNFANRKYDVPDWSIGETTGTFDAISSVSQEIKGIKGFITDVGTDLSGTTAPSINFTMTFVQASTAISDFINTTF
tara:strand:+ start:858 stop:1583 length:726 start_codon:yes stop_codon:yes gene_type:complete